MESRQIRRARYRLPRRYFYQARRRERLRRFTLARNKVAQTFIDDLQKHFHKVEMLYPSAYTYDPQENLVKLQCSKCYNVWEIRFTFARLTDGDGHHAEYALSGASFLQNCKGKPNWRRK